MNFPQKDITSDICSILKSHKNDLAFVLGNGINRAAYGNKQDTSWMGLLQELYGEYSKNELPKINGGMSYTELYDIIEMHQNDNVLRTHVIEKYSQWKPVDFHQRLFKSLKEFWNVPVLTTNFDLNLEIEDIGFSKHLMKYPVEGGNKGYKFSNYYPWNSYYGRIGNWIQIFNEFSVWHINGTVNYKNSIKLGLTQYISQCQHARKYIHKGNDNLDLFNGKNVRYWDGINSWLHLIFNKSLCIIGLTLDANEVFLRWLLIERKKYLNKKKFDHEGWYICTNDEIKNQEDKKFFLNEMGFEVVDLGSYNDIYREIFGL